MFIASLVSESYKMIYQSDHKSSFSLSYYPINSSYQCFTGQLSFYTDVYCKSTFLLNYYFPVEFYVCTFMHSVFLHFYRDLKSLSLQSVFWSQSLICWESSALFLYVQRYYSWKGLQGDPIADLYYSIVAAKNSCSQRAVSPTYTFN